jgi:acyl-[acyl carrier protein]--UDP-N-acetylglucosamine O-acyltransferase
MKNYAGDYDDYATIGFGAEIGEYVRIGKYVAIGDGARIGKYVAIGDSAEIGDGVRIDSSTKIGDNARIGKCVEIGDYAKIGDGARFGAKFRCEGLEVIDFFTMANVDGTGRRIYIYIHTKGITIRAGCFKGTLDEFCERAEDEGKYLYAITVRAAAEAFAAEIKRQGKTGGWDK